MSDNLLNLIPEDPSFVPNSSAQTDAKIFLTRYYPDKQIELITTDQIEFVDQGSNFDTVSCNVCGHLLNIEAWQDAMDNAFEKQFNDLEFTTPCCKEVTSLNKLQYEMPAGFARHRMCISNPQNPLPSDDISKLENLVGRKLRVVWAHY